MWWWSLYRISGHLYALVCWGSFIGHVDMWHAFTLSNPPFHLQSRLRRFFFRQYAIFFFNFRIHLGYVLLHCFGVNFLDFTKFASAFMVHVIITRNENICLVNVQIKFWKFCLETSGATDTTIKWMWEVRVMKGVRNAIWKTDGANDVARCMMCVCAEKLNYLPDQWRIQCRANKSESIRAPLAWCNRAAFARTLRMCNYNKLDHRRTLRYPHRHDSMYYCLNPCTIHRPRYCHCMRYWRLLNYFLHRFVFALRSHLCHRCPFARHLNSMRWNIHHPLCLLRDFDGASVADGYVVVHCHRCAFAAN